MQTTDSWVMPELVELEVKDAGRFAFCPSSTTAPAKMGGACVETEFRIFRKRRSSWGVATRETVAVAAADWLAPTIIIL